MTLVIRIATRRRVAPRHGPRPLHDVVDDVQGNARTRRSAGAHGAARSADPRGRVAAA